MDLFKIVTGFFCGFLMVLLSLFIFFENPEKELFENSVESIMIHEGMSSFQEVLDSFPEFNDINSQMRQISNLKSNINNISGGPAPNVSREQSQQIQEYSHKIQQLRSSIKEDLTQIVDIHIEDQP